MAFDITAATPILKQYYTKKKIESLVFESVTLAKIPKDTNGSGVAYVGAIRSAIPASVSGTDTVAFATTGGSIYNGWVCPWRFGYASANITGRLRRNRRLISSVTLATGRTLEAAENFVSQKVRRLEPMNRRASQK